MMCNTYVNYKQLEFASLKERLLIIIIIIVIIIMLLLLYN